MTALRPNHRLPSRPRWLGLVLSAAVAACGGGSGAGPGEAAAPAGAEEVPAAVIAAPDPRAAPAPEPTPSWAEATLASMSLQEKAAQVLMPWVLGDFAPEGSSSRRRIVTYVEEVGVGGVIMSVGTPVEVAVKLNDLQARARIPLLVAADLESGAGFRMRGAVHMPGTIELGGATDFPSLMALGATGDPGLAYEMGRVTAVEARAVGIHVPFAPVLDVNNNPDNPIINVRSFGEDPALVAALGTAFVRGVQEHGAVATGKHFPGHGDTEVDSHLELPVIRHDPARLDSVELRPFRDAVAAGMGGVMTAHIAVPALNGGNGDPSTLSAAVLTDLLRGELGFDGIVFTDAMDMRAISGRLGAGEAAVRALEAGADVLLMPPAVEEVRDALVDAVEEGRLPPERLDDAVLRILRTKERLQLHRERFVPVEEIPARVGIPEHLALADSIARRSITVLENRRNLLPLRGTRTARVLSITYRRTSDVLAGRYFNATLRRTYPRLATATLDRDAPASLYEGLMRQARRSALVVVSSYVTAVSYAGSVALPEETVDFIQALGREGIPHIVVSFGNPYLIREFPGVRAYVLAWSGSEASQRAAADALFARFPITGRSPTRIPPSYEIGAGIQIPARTGRE